MPNGQMLYFVFFRKYQHLLGALSPLHGQMCLLALVCCERNSSWLTSIEFVKQPCHERQWPCPRLLLQTNITILPQKEKAEKKYRNRNLYYILITSQLMRETCSYVSRGSNRKGKETDVLNVESNISALQPNNG